MVEAVLFRAALCSTSHNCDVSVQKSIISNKDPFWPKNELIALVPNSQSWCSRLFFFLLAGSLKQWRTPHPTKHIYLKTIIYYVSNKSVGSFFFTFKLSFEASCFNIWQNYFLLALSSLFCRKQWCGVGLGRPSILWWDSTVSHILDGWIHTQTGPKQHTDIVMRD